MHDLFMQCRLSDSQSQAARLVRLAERGHWYAQPCYIWLCKEGGPFIPSDKEKVAAYLENSPAPVILDNAKIGNKFAQFILGWFYTQAGVHRKVKEGVKFYRLAVEQGLAEARRALGLCYFYGRYGVPVDKTEAVRLYSLAAQQGLAAAQCGLAACYNGGEGGLELDKVEGLRWYILAAEQGFAQAQFRVGQAYAAGSGVSQSMLEARKYYELAAAQGNAEAQAELTALQSNKKLTE